MTYPGEAEVHQIDNLVQKIASYSVLAVKEFEATNKIEFSDITVLLHVICTRILLNSKRNNISPFPKWFVRLLNRRFVQGFRNETDRLHELTTAFSLGLAYRNNTLAKDMMQMLSKMEQYEHAKEKT